MTGMDRETGKPLSGTPHLHQSLADILWTLLGTRVGRRDYGSILLDLIDQPGNPIGRQRVVAAIAGAIARWEPRLRLTRVHFTTDASGAATIAIEGDRTDLPAATDPARFIFPARLLAI